MSDWWYNNGEKEEGPITLPELTELFEKNIITTKTLIWKKGFDSWRELTQVSELSNILINEPPPIPTGNSTASVFVNFPDSGPWKRFFARIFDTFWQNLLMQFLIAIMLGAFSPGFVDWIVTPGAEQVFALMTLPVALVFDGFIQGIFGASPGKAMLGLRVLKSNGEILSIGENIARNVSLWASGYALGIPFISLFTMANQHSRLKKGKPASYDEPYNYQVKAKPIKWYRYLLFIFSFMVLMFIIALIRTLEQQM